MKVKVILRAKIDKNLMTKPTIRLRTISSSMKLATAELMRIYKNFPYVRISFYRNDDGSFIKTLYFRYGILSKI